MPSLTGETFGLAAAAGDGRRRAGRGLAIGALPELIPPAWLSAPGDAPALAATIATLMHDPGAGGQALERVRRLLEPAALASRLAAIYAG